MSAHAHNHSSSVEPARRAQTDVTAPRRRVRAGSDGSSPGLRLKVRLTRGRLERRIAAGEPRGSSPELALREAQLTDPRSQRRIARDLRRVVAYADAHRSGRAISSVVIDARMVRRGRWAIVELAEQLERAGKVDPRGVVLARELLTDGSGPLFNRHADRTVARAARDVRDALDGRLVAAGL
ncbi:MAG TPA: hypothetical protein VN618_10965 [Solirubrobacteraceae bacterium]|nr:hypothetical protein [Solirubrobacteraceae bacterium]